jgi:hypothetical protein
MSALKVNKLDVKNAMDNNWVATTGTTGFTAGIVGTGDSGSRSAAFVGGATGGASTWWGILSTPQFAIDSKNGGGAEFWSHNNGSWLKNFEFTHNGALQLNGGGGGIALNITNGGDIRLTNSSNNYQSIIWTDGTPTGSNTTEATWVPSLVVRNQRCVYDRSWENYPSITIPNTTDYGPQGEFRIHGANGVNGGDFSAPLRVDGGFITGSDARRKTNVESIENALDIIKQLDGKKFNIINSEGDLDPMRGDKKQYGLIAQECINIIPEAVKFYEESNTPNENGWASAYSIEYDKITAVLINAIKELNIKLETAEAKIAALEGNQ